MTSERDPVQLAVDAFGQESGFAKKSGSWYRSSDEVVVVLNLQKSQHSTRYYLNVAFWLRRLGDERFPKEQHCHIRLRLEDLAPDIEEELTDLLNLERDLPAGGREERLLSLIHRTLDPVLPETASIAGLRESLDAGTFAAAAITGPAQEALRASSP